MRPLRRPDDETRSDLLTQILGVDFDPTREYTAGQIVKMGVEVARHMVQGLFRIPQAEVEDVDPTRGGDPENDV